MKLNPADDPVIATRCSTEAEAVVLRDELRREGVQAEASGGLSGGMRLEAPGSVDVLVHRKDLERARKLIDDFRERPLEIDWSKVDVGEPTEDV